MFCRFIFIFKLQLSIKKVSKGEKARTYGRLNFFTAPLYPAEFALTCIEYVLDIFYGLRQQDF